MNKTTLFYEETISIPTYEPGEDDILPPLIPSMCPRAKGVYPYPLQELVGEVKKEKQYRVLILENDYLKLTFLPSLGGRLISAYEKSGRRELLFRNPVLKPLMAGLTGAWCGIGIEFNFPGSHSVTSNTPVHCSGENGQDGSASVTISDREVLSEMKWRIRITLAPDSDVIIQESFFFNRTSLPHHGYFWTNAKVPAFHDTEFIFPPHTKGLIHPPMDITRITELKLPYVNGVDISEYSKVYFQLPLFFRNMRSSAFGVYHREKQQGILHFADPGILCGRKIWTLGTGDDGKVSNENLTEDGAPNIEIQSGPLPLQTDFFFLNPGASKCWTEYWIPVSCMGKYLAGNMYFTLSEDNGNLKIQCHKNLDFFSCELSNASQKWEDFAKTGKMITLKMETPYSGIRIFDKHGFILLEHDPEMFLSDKKKMEINQESAEALYLQGLYCQELNNRLKAVDFFRKALQRDPSYTKALTGLGIDCLERGEYELAVKHLELALYKNRRSPEISYYLGYAYLKTGNTREGCFQLQRARFDGTWKNAAAVELAKHFLQKRLFADLQAIFKEELFDEMDNLCIRSEQEPLLELYAIFQRLSGRKNALTLDGLRKIAPENPLPCIEAFLQENIAVPDQDYKKILLAVKFYDEIAMPEDARKIAEAFCQKNPLLNYLAGDINSAEKQALDKIFPFSIWLAEKLGQIALKNPSAQKIYYYKGLIHASLSDWETAMQEWKKSEIAGLKEPALFRNMGLCEWKIFARPKEALKYYEKGLMPKKISYKYIYEYDQLLEECGELKKRKTLFTALPCEIFENPYVTLRRAKLEFDQQNYKKTILLLSERKFVLCEGKRMTSGLFIDANLQLGIQQLNNGDSEAALTYFKKALSYLHNLGVGRSKGEFDMKTKYYILLALKHLGWKEEFQRKKEEFLKENKEFSIDFQALNTIRWESGTVAPDLLLNENKEYSAKITKLA